MHTTCLTFLEKLRDQKDEITWNEFHDRYGELLYSYAGRCGATHEEAEDIVQEVEMYLFRAMNRFHYDAGKGKFRAYLRSAVVHAVSRRAAKLSGREAKIDPHTLDSLLQEDSQEDAHWEREWRLHCVRNAFRSVASEFEVVTMEAFCLHVLCNRPVAETAEHLGISKASVYQAKSRVLKRLKQRIDAGEQDDGLS